MKPDITIITCSYNKPQYILDAVDSVLNQTFTDFEYLILENSNDGQTRDIVHTTHDPRVKIINVDVSDKERRRIYIESHLKNTHTPNALGKYVMYLADDDTLEPTCFEDHLKEFKRNPSQGANYHACKIIYLGSEKPDDVIPATLTFGPNRLPKERIDGGSVMFTKEIFSKLPQPFFKRNWFDAHISDTLFLNKLSRAATLHPINKILHTKRITPISVHTYINNQGIPWFFRPRHGFDRPQSSGRI